MFERRLPTKSTDHASQQTEQRLETRNAPLASIDIQRGHLAIRARGLRYLQKEHGCRFQFVRIDQAVPAYIIVEIEILDPVGYEEYKKLAGATVEKYGGKYVVRGGKTEVLEGDWQPKRVVVLEFESSQRAKEWLNCEEYREPRKMRHRTARTNMILVEGL